MVQNDFGEDVVDLVGTVQLAVGDSVEIPVVD